jgi:hypothetical protein
VPELEEDADPELQPTADSRQPTDTGVTPSADWEVDEDPASYSAPI